MIRFFSFILQIGVLAAVAIWLADQPGTAHIVWHDTVIETSAAFLALCVLGVGYAIHLLFRLWHFVWNGPVHWRLRRKISKLQRGHDQLAQGLIAIASGNASEAGRLAVASRKNMSGTRAGGSIFPMWLQAQAAQLAGDHLSARAIFKNLAADDTSVVLGYRGLITEAKQAGDWKEVERLMTELHTKKPATPWLSLIRMESAARRGQWNESEQALSHATAARLLDSEAGRRTRSALRIASSRDAAAIGNDTEALHAAEQAVRQSADWLPAIINLAEILTKRAHKRAAQRLIERAWKETPHPQLADLIRQQSTDGIEALRQVEHLCRSNEASTESRIALAETALAANVWGEARRHLLASVATGNATQNVYKLLAKLERRQFNDETKASSWLLKAADAPLDPSWICQECGGGHIAWEPVCRHCGTFESVSWQVSGQKTVTTLSNYKHVSDVTSHV